MPPLSGIVFYGVNDARKNHPKVSPKCSIRRVPSTENFLRYRGHVKKHPFAHELLVTDKRVEPRFSRLLRFHPRRHSSVWGGLRTSLAHSVAPTATKVSFFSAVS